MITLYSDLIVLLAFAAGYFESPTVAIYSFIDWLLFHERIFKVVYLAFIIIIQCLIAENRGFKFESNTFLLIIFFESLPQSGPSNVKVSAPEVGEAWNVSNK